MIDASQIIETPSISDVFKELTVSTPENLPACCSSLSLSLIQHLASLLPPDPALTLSVGSGTGLLEALLLYQRPTLDLKAVEVPSTNSSKYMPVDKMRIVNGYRDLCDLAADASAWMFIYPRDTWLLQQYVRAFGDQKCELIIWIGPRADQLENDVFGDMWMKEDFENCGLRNYEVMTLWRRTKADSKASTTVEKSI